MKTTLALSLGAITLLTIPLSGQDALQDSSPQAGKSVRFQGFAPAEESAEATPFGLPVYGTDKNEAARRPRVAAPTATRGGSETNRRDGASRLLGRGGGGGLLGARGGFGGGRKRGASREDKLRVEVENLKDSLLDKSTPAEGVAKITQRLQDSLEELFDVRTQTREKQIADLETRIETLRKQLDERKAKKGETVQLRLQTLVNESNGLTF